MLYRFVSLALINPLVIFKFFLINFKVAFVFWIEGQMLVADIAVIPILFDHGSPDVREIVFLKNDNLVCLLCALSSSEDRVDVKLGVVLDFFRVNDQHYVYFFLCG